MNQTLNFNRAALLNALQIAIVHAATEDNRPVLNRVNFVDYRGSIAAVGTDGYRIGIVELIPTPLDSVSFGIDRSDVKTLIKALSDKSVKSLETVEVEIVPDVMQIEVQEPIRDAAHYNRKTRSYETRTVIRDIDIHRIRVLNLEFTSNVWQVPDVTRLIPDFNEKSSMQRIMLGSTLQNLYIPQYKDQRRKELDVAKVLKQQNQSKWNIQGARKKFHVAAVQISNITTWFNSSYLNDSVNTLNPREVVTLYFWDNRYNESYESNYPVVLIQGTASIMIMPRKASDDGIKVEEMQSINLSL